MYVCWGQLVCCPRSPHMHHAASSQAQLSPLGSAAIAHRSAAAACRPFIGSVAGRCTRNSCFTMACLSGAPKHPKRQNQKSPSPAPPPRCASSPQSRLPARGSWRPAAHLPADPSLAPAARRQPGSAPAWPLLGCCCCRCSTGRCKRGPPSTPRLQGRAGRGRAQEAVLGCGDRGRD